MKTKLCTNVHNINIDFLLKGLGYIKSDKYNYILKTDTRIFTLTMNIFVDDSIIFYMYVTDYDDNEVASHNYTLYELMKFYIQKGTQICCDDKTRKKISKYNKKKEEI